MAGLLDGGRLGGGDSEARWLREVSARADDWVNLASNPATDTSLRNLGNCSFQLVSELPPFGGEKSRVSGLVVWCSAESPRLVSAVG